MRPTICNWWKSWDHQRHLLQIIEVNIGAHCVLLEHYYSVDFPWWFDRKISFLSKSADNMMIGKKKLLNDRNTKLHFAIWQKKTCFCWILSACSSGLRFQINLEAKSMHGSSWKKILLYQNLLYFLQGKSFSPWMASNGHNLDKFWFAFWEKV